MAAWHVHHGVGPVQAGSRPYTSVLRDTRCFSRSPGPRRASGATSGRLSWTSSAVLEASSAVLEGVRQVGYRPYLAWDCDQDALETYRRNYRDARHESGASGSQAGSQGGGY